MKKINKIKLSSLSNEDLNKREMNKLLGGDVCCVCGCKSGNETNDRALSLHVHGKIDDEGGYGTVALA